MSRKATKPAASDGRRSGWRSPRPGSVRPWRTPWRRASWPNR